MKKVILAVTLVVGLSLMSEAQDNNQTKANLKQERVQLSPQERATKDTERAEKNLGLNAEQKAKWQAASLERANANEPLKEKMQSSTTPEERQQIRQQMKSNGDKFESTVNGFLTPEQKTKYAEMKANYRGKHKGDMKHRESGTHNSH